MTLPLLPSVQRQQRPFRHSFRPASCCRAPSSLQGKYTKGLAGGALVNIDEGLDRPLAASPRSA